MKKKYVCLTAGLVAAFALTACGQGNAAAAPAETEKKPVETEAAAPETEAVSEEETEKPAPFEANLSSYEELILSAPADYYYCFADLDEENDALILTSADLTFDNGDGTTAATGGYIYCYGDDGNIMEYGYVEGGGTATPLAVGEGHILFYGGRDYMNEVSLDLAAEALNIDEGEYFDAYEDVVTLAFFPVATFGNSDEEEYDGPSDFVQEQSGKLTFQDFDEVISCLTSGQGYTKLNFAGADALIVAEEVNPEDHTAESASVYVMFEGAPVQAGYVYTQGFPLRLADGLIYAGTDSNYEVDFLNPEGNGLMVKDYVYRDDTEGEISYGGFTREKNDFDSDQEFTGGEEEFNALLKAREEKPVIEFTIVE